VNGVASAAPAVKGRFRRVMFVVLENASYDEAAQQPFLASLGRRGALLSNVTAEAHPSQPNYLALVAGSTFGVRSDRNVDLDGRQLGDLLEAKGLQWKVYAEGFPGHCFLGEKQGDYVRKHTPMLSFKDVQSNSARCGRVVEATQLSQDLQNGTLPDFSLYVPNLKNDGHDTSVAFADKWLAGKFGPLLADPRFTKDLLFVVTFDEAERVFLWPSSNRVLTVAVGDAVRPGSTSNAPYTHYSILRSVEDALGTGTLGREDANAAAINGIWR
jgi:Phosphoesterase family